MSPSRTDQDLLRLLESKSPEELTVAELHWLRQRLRHSESLRQTLFEQLQMETYLATALGRINLTPESIFQREAERRSSPARRYIWTAAAVTILLLAAAYFFRAGRQDAATVDASRQAVAARKSKASAKSSNGSSNDTPSEKADEAKDETTNGTPGKSGGARPGKDPSGQSAPDNTKASDPAAANSGDAETKSPAAPMPGEKPGESPEAGTASNQPIPDPSVGGGVKPETATRPADELPWTAVLQDQSDLPAFAEICFDSFDITKSLTRRETLRKWFEPVDGQPQHIVDARATAGQCSAIDGVLRLQAPLKPQLGLRIWMENYHRLQIHFFHETRGITLVYHEDDNSRWSAYEVTREPNAVQPKTWSLVATDEGRARRTNLRLGGPLMLWHDGSRVMLTRGDIVLVEAPFADTPNEILFAGKATFFGIAAVRSQPPRSAGSDSDTNQNPDAQGGPKTDRPVHAAEQKQPQAPTILSFKPAELTWSESLAPNAKLDRNADGTVQLTADNTAMNGWAMAALPRIGLQEIVLHLRDLKAGVGIFLGKPGQDVASTLRVMTDRRNGGLGLAVRGKDEVREDNFPGVGEKYAPVLQTDAWIKLVVGSGVARCWIGRDGQQWAELEQTLPVPVGVTHLGLHHVAMSPGSKLQLSRVELRPLSTLESMVDSTILSQAKPILEAPQRETWQQQAEMIRPANIDAVVWRRAVAIQTLAAGCTRTIGEPLALDLLTDIATLGWDIEKQLRGLSEGALLLDLRNTPTMPPLLVDRFYQLGQQLVRADHPTPYSAVRTALMNMPLDTKATFAMSDPQLIRIELLSLLYRSEWEEAVEFCRRVRFFHQQDQVPLLDWGEALARRESPGIEKPSQKRVAIRRPIRLFRRPNSTLAKQKSAWQHPFVEELNKDTYNMMAELQSVVEGGLYEDAARMISSLDADAVQGVSLTANDDQLLATLPVVVRLLTREHTPLRDVTQRTFGQISELRIREAMATGNLSAVRLAITQFESTPAAQEACQWLGDRAMAEGEFGLAFSEYQRGLRLGSGPQPALLARQRFAASMLGVEWGERVTTSVSIGGQTWNPDAFEAMIAEQRARNGGSQGSQLLGSLPATLLIQTNAAMPEGFGNDARLQTPPPPGMQSSIQPRAAIDGALGDAPAEEITRGINRLQVDWAGRQLGTIVDGTTLYASNRFQVAAFQVANGQRVWQTAPAGLKSLKSRDWTNIPMRPALLGNNLYVRLLYGDGPVLASMERASGKVNWLSSELKGQWVVSDPIPRRDRILALTLQRLELNESVLRLTAFDAETGEVVSQSDLLRLNLSWMTRRCCEVAILDDGLLAVLGGVTVCCDFQGNVRWIRKQVVLPFDEEPDAVAQYYDPPLIRGNEACYAQPGVRAIDCVELDTGRLKWSRFLPDVLRIVAWQENTVVVQYDHGLRGLDAATGSTKWEQRSTDNMTLQMASPTVSKSPDLLFARSIRVDAGKKLQPQLVWLDIASGNIKSIKPLPELDGEEPRLGPAVRAGNRLWTFFGRGQAEPKRELLEIVLQ